MNEVIQISGYICKANVLGKLGEKVIVKGKVGEIIEQKENVATIQIYENPYGIKVGDKVELTNQPLVAKLGPGLLGNIFDGLGRKLNAMEGIFVSQENNESRKWHFIPLKKKGEKVKPGEKVGYVEELGIKHYILVPPNVEGEIKEIKEGDYEENDIVYKINDKSLGLFQYWPIRKTRPVNARRNPNSLLFTGQRIIDLLFPIAKGGTAAVPGPFGSGKTVLLHQIAKWADADIIIYIGCGERGNEIADMLQTFPKVIDPKTNKSIMNRSIIIANTSNMPVAARETSIYIGTTIGEYYRDMGYNVIVIADSTSRWAEALREISSTLEELPAEEGYPAYLQHKISEFYERAGEVITLNNELASLTIIGAVSPPGGDLSDPVVQATLREVKTFWGLSAELARARQFPAIDWITSYSFYTELLSKEEIKIREWMINKLNSAKRIEQLSKIIGEESLPEEEKEILSVGELIKQGFLSQNAFDPSDERSEREKTIAIAKKILEIDEKWNNMIKENKKIEETKDEDIKSVMKIRYDWRNKQ